MTAWPLRLMIYAGGEAINGASALAPQIRAQLTELLRVCTNQTVAATAQLDASDVPTLRLVLDPSGRQPVQSLPNVNVGDPGNLTDFVSWSEAICPADRRVLVLSGHGAAWQDAQTAALLGTRTAARRPGAVPVRPGALHHARTLFGTGVSPAGSATRALLIDGRSRDFLSNAELGAACDTMVLRMGRRFDAIVFDACLMSAWEILHELSDATTTVVGAIDELSAAGIPIAAAATALTQAGGTASPQEIGRSFVQGFRPQADFDSCVAIDLSAAGWAEGAGALQSCAIALLGWVAGDEVRAQAVRGALALAATSVVRYQDGGLADIGSLASALGGIDGAPPPVTSSAAAMTAALSSCVLARSTGFDYRAALGLSLFAPSSRSTYLDNRADYMRLQLPSQSGWARLLDMLYAAG